MFNWYQPTDAELTDELVSTVIDREFPTGCPHQMTKR